MQDLSDTTKTSPILILAGLNGVLTKLIANPWFAYDPINLPKMG